MAVQVPAHRLAHQVQEHGAQRWADVPLRSALGRQRLREPAGRQILTQLLQLRLGWCVRREKGWEGARYALVGAMGGNECEMLLSGDSLGSVPQRTRFAFTSPPTLFINRDVPAGLAGLASLAQKRSVGTGTSWRLGRIRRAGTDHLRGERSGHPVQLAAGARPAFRTGQSSTSRAHLPAGPTPATPRTNRWQKVVRVAAQEGQANAEQLDQLRGHDAQQVRACEATRGAETHVTLRHTSLSISGSRAQP